MLEYKGNKNGGKSMDNKPINTLFMLTSLNGKPHLNEKGIEYLCNWVDILFLVTDKKKQQKI